MMKTPKQHITDDARLMTDGCRSEIWPLTTPDDPDWDEVIPYVPTGIEDETWTCAPVGGTPPTAFEVRNERGQLVATVPVDDQLTAEIAERLDVAIARLPEALRQIEDQSVCG